MRLNTTRKDESLFNVDKYFSKWLEHHAWSPVLILVDLTILSRLVPCIRAQLVQISYEQHADDVLCSLLRSVLSLA